MTYVQVLCMGTPAEESGSGKIQLLKAGAFTDVDFAMMIHPAPVDILNPAVLGVASVSYFMKRVPEHSSIHHTVCRLPRI